MSKGNNGSDRILAFVAVILLSIILMPVAGLWLVGYGAQKLNKSYAILGIILFIVGTALIGIVFNK